jgi:hypothetical protein
MNESELMKEMQFFYGEDQLKEIVESVTVE